MVAGLSSPFMASAAKTHGNVLDLKHSITDNAIVYPESFEADTQKLLESWFIKNYTASDNRYATEPDANVSDEEIIRRLSALPTLIEMPFNQIVRSYIDRYTKRGRSQIEAVLGLSLYYMPIFEQALEEQGLPLELKYLPVIESGLDPNAVSKHGATGLWQFMLVTAKGLGLEVNSLVDERRDPYLSSEMAANYLKGLYETYGDWSLAIAAYNCGPGTVNKAIRRAGGEAKDHDFWSIYNYLPAETRGYVPMFIAANYVMTYYPQHNISPVLPVKPLVMDTIHISERLHFNQISEVLDIPVEELRILNPQFRADIIPGSQDISYNLILPSQQIHAFLMSEDEIRNCNAAKYAQREVVDPGENPADEILAVEVEEIDIWPDDISDQLPPKPAVTTTSTEKKSLIVHKVSTGETLGSIAAMYNVTTDDIKKSNNLRRNAVRVGQQLRISTSSPKAASSTYVADNTPAAQPVAPKRTSTTAAAQPAKQTTASTKQTANNNKQASNTKQQANNTKQQGKNNKQTANANTQQNKKNNTAAKKTQAKAPTSHDIKNGENLTTIAKKYGVSVDDLKKANNMKDDKIQAGKSLKLPSKNANTKGAKGKNAATQAKNTKATGKKKKK